MIAFPSSTFSRRAALVAGLALTVAAASGVSRSSADEGRVLPPPAVDDAGSGAVAVLAGGCFWGVQGVFQHVEGVSNAVSGYAGGEEDTATYEQVGTGRTGHAEAVKITFDPAKISYGRLLQIFFSVAHDPTEVDRQGPDEGPQYRTAIFPADAEQARVARAYIEQLDKARLFKEPIATTIESGKRFHAAEDYHQDFLTRHPTHPYIVYNDLPKIDALKRIFSERYREKPALVSAAK